MAMFKNSQKLNVQNFLTLQFCFQMQKHLENLQAYHLSFFPPLESNHLFLNKKNGDATHVFSE